MDKPNRLYDIFVYYCRKKDVSGCHFGTPLSFEEVKDKISLSKYENEYSTKFKDIFDFSEDDNYSLFFTKDKSVEVEISVMFYQINKNSKISLIINDVRKIPLKSPPTSAITVCILL